MTRYGNDIRAIRRVIPVSFASARKYWWRSVGIYRDRGEISRALLVELAAGDYAIRSKAARKKRKPRGIPCPATGAFRKYVDRYDTPDGRRDLIVFLRARFSAGYKIYSKPIERVFPLRVGRFTKAEADRWDDKKMMEYVNLALAGRDWKTRLASLEIAGKGWLKDLAQRKGLRLSGKGSRRVRGKHGRKGNRRHRGRGV